MNEKPRHAPIQAFDLVDDQLILGGKTLKQLAAQAGSTPFYVYEGKALIERARKLRSAMPEGLSIHYAVKANPFPPVVKHLLALVDGLDIASAGELQTALQAGADPNHVSFAGPGKSDPELRAAIEAGVCINLESAAEMQRVQAFGEQLGKRPRVAIRVNPDFELKSSGMKMGGGARPFGIDAEAVPQVLKEAMQLDLDVQGLHIFSGSQNLDADRLIEAQTATFELAYRLCESAALQPSLLNIGGGFGIPYFPGDQPLDLGPIGAGLARHLETCRARLGDTEVILELGRYLVGEAGVYVCEVVERKVSRGQTYLICNGGMHHNLAASGNLGQFIRKNYPVINPMQVTGGERETVNVVGPLCTPLDILGEKLELAHTGRGDLVAVLQSGAYGLSASPRGFLGHPEPVELLV